MNSIIKYVVGFVMVAVFMPVPFARGQIALSSGVIAEGGATATGSHRLVATFGQAIIGSSGSTLLAGFWSASRSLTNVAVEDDSSLPRDFSLDQNYPNPFNPTTVISYHVSAVSHVQLKIYDVFGREVATLVDGNIPGGTYTVHFNADQLASGVYLYRLLATDVNDASGGRVIETRKMVLLH